MNVSRYKHLPPMLALAVSLALLSGCNKPASDTESPPPAADATAPDATAPAEEPATMPAPPSTMTNNSYEDAQGTSNETPASMPPPVDSNESSQNAGKQGDATSPPPPPAGDDGNGG